MCILFFKVKPFFLRRNFSGLEQLWTKWLRPSRINRIIFKTFLKTEKKNLHRGYIKSLESCFVTLMLYSWLRLWPTYASAHNNIGTLLNADSAEQHFLKAIKYNRHHVNAHYNLGKLYK